MTIEIPDVLFESEEQKKQISVDLACFLFEKGLMSSGKAAEFCGMPRIEFWDELGKRNISRYNEEMLQMDLETIRKMHRNDSSKWYFSH